MGEDGFRTAAGSGGHPADLSRCAAAALAEVASGRRALRAVKHPLGFLCLPVRREGEYGLCVHLFGMREVWSGPEEAVTSVLHAHSWDLTSQVLYGRVANVRFRVRDDVRHATHRVYEVDSGAGGVDLLRPTARLVRRDRRAVEASGRGEVYVLPAGEFHTTVVPPGRTAATAVLGRSRPGRADLSLGPVDGTAHRMVRLRCDPGETARLARAALARLDGPAGRTGPAG